MLINRLPKHFFKTLWIALLVALCPCQGWSLIFPLPPKGTDVVGKVYTIKAQQNDNFDAIAERYNVGFYELMEANPHLNPDHIADGTQVLIPARYLLPKTRKGLVLNIAEMRLYYFPQDKNVVYTYPIGIGKQGEMTPTGHFYILEKIKHPIWHVPPSTKRDYAKRHEYIPNVVGAGIQNPLGNYTMRMNTWSYMIHGTNMPSSVGKRSSAGCVHLYPEDVEHLFYLIPVKTPVEITNQNYKLGYIGGHLYLESERPLLEQQTFVANDESSLLNKTINQFTAKSKRHPHVNWKVANQVALAQTGIPTRID